MSTKFIINEELYKQAIEPGPAFRDSFDKYPMLWENMERQLCPRVHFKHIIIDGKLAIPVQPILRVPDWA